MNAGKNTSMNIMEVAEAVSKNINTNIVGIRPGEKLHEQMIGREDAPFIFEYDEHFKILPMINGFNSKDRIKNGKKVAGILNILATLIMTGCLLIRSEMD